MLVQNAGVEHGFTAWDIRPYDALADWRSWDAMLEVFDMILDSDDDDMDSNLTEAIGDMMTEMMEESEEEEAPVEEEVDPEALRLEDAKLSLSQPDAMMENGAC